VNQIDEIILEADCQKLTKDLGMSEEEIKVASAMSLSMAEMSLAASHIAVHARMINANRRRFVVKCALAISLQCMKDIPEVDA